MPNIQSVISSEKERNLVISKLTAKMELKEWDKLDKKIEKREGKRRRGERISPIAPKYKAMGVLIEDRFDKLTKIFKREGKEYVRYGDSIVTNDEGRLTFWFVVPQFRRMTAEQRDMMKFLEESEIEVGVYRGEDI